MLNYSCRTDFIICNHFFLCHKKSFLQKDTRKKLSDYNITEKIKTSVYNSQKTAPGPRFDIQAFAEAVVIFSLWETALFFKIMLFERRRSEFMILKNVFSSLSQA